MNNPMPFIYPYQPVYHPQINQNDFDKLLSKIEKMENDIKDLKNRIVNLEKKDNSHENISDMYFI